MLIVAGLSWFAFSVVYALAAPRDAQRAWMRETGYATQPLPTPTGNHLNDMLDRSWVESANERAPLIVSHRDITIGAGVCVTIGAGLIALAWPRRTRIGTVDAARASSAAA